MLEQPLLFTGCSSIQTTFSKLLPQKLHFRKLFSLKTLTSIYLIYFSSESSEELSKSSIICVITFFSMYLHSFKNTCG